MIPPWRRRDDLARRAPRRAPEAAKDIELNIESVLRPGALSQGQRWGVAVAAAAAARDPTLRDAVVDDARREVSPEVGDDGLAAAALMAMNNVHYRSSLAVSAINACETCMKSHEKVVIEGGLTEDQVHDAIRIAATV